MSSKFFDHDLPHSKVKRRILKGILQAFFGIHFSSFPKFKKNKKVGEFSVTYFDAFSGPGRFDLSDENCKNYLQTLNNDETVPWPGQTLEEDDSEYGSPIIAVHNAVVLTNRLLNRAKKNPDLLKRAPDAMKMAKFVLVEKDADFLRVLIAMVIERFEISNFTLVHELHEKRNDVDVIIRDFQREVEIEGRLLTFIMRVEFINENVENIPIKEFLPRSRPLFSFVDPFGIKSIPMKMMENLIGPKKYLLINLNVQAINRSCKGNEEVINNLYADDSWLELRSIEETNPKLEQFTNLYEEKLKSMRRPFTTTGRFYLKKGKSDPYVNFIFSLVFVSQGYNMLNKIKSKFMINMQEKFLPEFSDYYFHSDKEVPLGRKTTDEDEARVIFQYFKGQKKVPLYKIKIFVLEETPFPYHAKALKWLEDNRWITNVDENGGPKRKGKEFCHEVSFWPKQNAVRKKTGDCWLVDFATEESAILEPTPMPTTGKKKKDKSNKTNDVKKAEKYLSSVAEEQIKEEWNL